MELTYVIYSHTEFLNFLQITCDFLENVPNKILIINKTDIEHELFSKFSKVIFYDDTLPYTDKVSEVLKKIESKYILFTHEVDIPLSRDEVVLNKFLELMELKNMDRIDLQPNGGNSGKFIKIEKEKDVKDWESVDLNQTEDNITYLGHHTDPNSYVYNVNPSIWKRESLIEIFDTFKNRTYRDIEYGDVQNYCLKFNIYNLYSKNLTLRCGYMNSLPIYKYLHITHYRRLLRYGSPWICEFGWSYADAAKEYIEIVEKYNLLKLGIPFS